MPGGEISIHAPHEGERLGFAHNVSPYITRFQSTLPTRGSDLYYLPRLFEYADFNPRSPRGGATLRQALWDDDG